jgi:hypothetical protein
MYHGTGIQNLSSILSEGLNTNHSRVYDEKYRNEDGIRHLQSYEGSYFSESLNLAIGAAYTSALKNKSSTKSSLIVMVKIEDTSPHILIDEDLIDGVGFFLSKNIGDIGHPGPLAQWISSGFSNIDNIVEQYYQSMISKIAGEVEGKKFLSDNRSFINLKPYLFDVFKKYTYRQFLIAMKSYYNEGDVLFDKIYNKYMGLPAFSDFAKVMQEYRDSFALFMQKAHRLTSISKGGPYSINMRSINPISYKGRNKIVIVSMISVIEGQVNIKIHYVSDMSVINKYIGDIKENYGDKFLMTYNNEIIYDKQREFQNELV